MFVCGLTTLFLVDASKRMGFARSEEVGIPGGGFAEALVPPEQNRDFIKQNSKESTDSSDKLVPRSLFTPIDSPSSAGCQFCLIDPSAPSWRTWAQGRWSAARRSAPLLSVNCTSASRWRRQLGWW